MSNNLQNETSPYLLQHAENPVHWYPWGEEAFEKAREEDKPIFLSIGYSTCHWCHVMAHESFENNETAQILNNDFISIKVDREERPDIDSVYMAVCQAFTGSGGWPMSIFMTWDKKPFFAGTYFPPISRYGMPGFPELLSAIAMQWKSDRTKLIESAEELITHLKNEESPKTKEDGENLSQKAVKIFAQNFDSNYGGFGSAPKFPTPHNLLFLMLYAKHNSNNEVMHMVEKTLIQMRKGGIFDHIGYGFSRYSTDRYYLAPHFEKMLYDNALLIIAYVSAYKMTNNHIYLDTAEKTAEYVLREMTSQDGGFYSAQDADSEGVEGKYYTFSLDEIISVLGEESGKKFARVFDITEGGNFEGSNIPNLLKSDNIVHGLDDEIEKLYQYRKDRFNLHLDDKILLSWNAMMIAALCMLYRVTENKRYIGAAEEAVKFIEKNLCDGLELYTSFREGKRSKHGFLDDYAYYIAALTELYNSTLDSHYLERAERFCKETVNRFSDDKGGFYLCKKESGELFLNPKETYDGATPSGNSVMAYNFMRLYQLTENSKYMKMWEKHMNYLTDTVQDYPAGHSMFLMAILLYQNPPKRIIVAIKDNYDLTGVTKKLPFLANVSVTSENVNYPIINGQPTYYVCNSHTCFPPTNILPFE